MKNTGKDKAGYRHAALGLAAVLLLAMAPLTAAAQSERTKEAGEPASIEPIEVLAFLLKDGKVYTEGTPYLVLESETGVPEDELGLPESLSATVLLPVPEWPDPAPDLPESLPDGAPEEGNTDATEPEAGEEPETPPESSVPDLPQTPPGEGGQEPEEPPADSEQAPEVPADGDSSQQAPSDAEEQQDSTNQSDSETPEAPETDSEEEPLEEGNIQPTAYSLPMLSIGAFLLRPLSEETAGEEEQETSLQMEEQVVEIRVTWQCGQFNPETPGLYVFEAVLPEGYVYSGPMPYAEVMVQPAATLMEVVKNYDELKKALVNMPPSNDPYYIYIIADITVVQPIDFVLYRPVYFIAYKNGATDSTVQLTAHPNSLIFRVNVAASTPERAVMDFSPFGGKLILNGFNYGGGISTYSRSSSAPPLTIKGAVFQNCVYTHSDAGPGTYPPGGLGLIPSEYGGAALLLGNTVADVSGNPDGDYTGYNQVLNCEFINNRSAGHGAAILATGKAGNNAVYIGNCTFTGNKSTIYGGGAIYSSKDTTLVVENSVFEDNYATHRGGAISSAAKATSLLNSQFYRNYIQNADVSSGVENPYTGGAVYLGGTQGAENKAWITGCTFVDNYTPGRRDNGPHTTPYGQGGTGGAVHIDSPSTETLFTCWLENNTFTGNRAGGRGGALYIAGGAYADMHGTNTFESNSVYHDTYRQNNKLLGGAVYIEGKGYAYIEADATVRHIGNSAHTGGGVYMEASASHVAIPASQVICTGNTALGDGGGFYVARDGDAEGDADARASLWLAGDSTFEGNTANTVFDLPLATGSTNEAMPTPYLRRVMASYFYNPRIANATRHSDSPLRPGQQFHTLYNNADISINAPDIDVSLEKIFLDAGAANQADWQTITLRLYMEYESGEVCVKQLVLHKNGQSVETLYPDYTDEQRAAVPAGQKLPYGTYRLEEESGGHFRVEGITITAAPGSLPEPVITYNLNGNPLRFSILPGMDIGAQSATLQLAVQVRNEIVPGTIPVALRKVDAQDISVHLQGAEFAIYRCDESHGTASHTGEPQNMGTCWQQEGPMIASDSDGLLLFEAAGPGSYALVELYPPGAYAPPEGYWLFTLQADGSITGLGAQGNPPALYALASPDADGVQYLVTNVAAYTLPATGAGGLLCLLAVLPMLAACGITWHSTRNNIAKAGEGKPRWF